jgi:hypothetical protein
MSSETSVLGWWSGLGDGGEQIQPPGATRMRGMDFPRVSEVEGGAVVVGSGGRRGGGHLGGEGTARWWVVWASAAVGISELRGGAVRGRLSCV